MVRNQLQFSQSVSKRSLPMEQVQLCDYELFGPCGSMRTQPGIAEHTVDTCEQNGQDCR